MQKYKIFLISGDPNTGKDTVCEFMAQAYGFKRVAFADKLRELCLYLLDDLYSCQVSINHFMDRELKESFILTKEDEIWRPNGVPMTYRQFLRTIATDCLRDRVQKTTWVDYVKRDIISVITAHKREYNGVCIPDWRFPNEFEELDKLLENFGNIIDLYTVRISRPDVNSVKPDHIEGLLKGFKFNFLLKNDSSLEELFKKVDKLVHGSYMKEKIILEQKQRGQFKFK